MDSWRSRKTWDLVLGECARCAATLTVLDFLVRADVLVRVDLEKGHAASIKVRNTAGVQRRISTFEITIE